MRSTLTKRTPSMRKNNGGQSQSLKKTVRWFYEDILEIDPIFLFIYLTLLPTVFMVVCLLGLLSFTASMLGWALGSIAGLALFFIPRINHFFEEKTYAKLSNLLFDPNTPSQKVAELVSCKFESLRGRAVQHPNLPLETVIGIMDSDDERVRFRAVEALLARTDTPVALLVDMLIGGRSHHVADYMLESFGTDDARLTAANLRNVVEITENIVLLSTLTEHRNLDFNTMAILLQSDSLHVCGRMYKVIRNMNEDKFASLVRNSEFASLAGLPREWILKSVGFDKDSVVVERSEYDYA